MTPHRRIALTGASGGIGLALAARLAAPGASMLLIARDAGRLARAAEAARAAGADVETALADVTDRAAMTAALTRFDASAPIDLLIANAGVSTGLGPDRAPERPEDAERVWRVNYGGMLNTVEPLLPALRARPGAQIALMSSIAALRPLPDMPSYSASKAAVRAYWIALRGWLRPQGVAVSVICPGFVTSPMSQRHLGFKPFEIGAERAAEIVARGLARRRAFITFPWPLAALAWLDQRLPPAVSDWFGQGFAARIEPDGR